VSATDNPQYRDKIAQYERLLAHTAPAEAGDGKAEAKSE